MASQEETFEAFVAGYRACLYTYAVHRDGELEVGVRRRRHREVSAAVPKDQMVLTDFACFLARKREADAGLQDGECGHRPCGTPVKYREDGPVVFCEDHRDRR